MRPVNQTQFIVLKIRMGLKAGVASIAICVEGNWQVEAMYTVGCQDNEQPSTELATHLSLVLVCTSGAGLFLIFTSISTLQSTYITVQADSSGSRHYVSSSIGGVLFFLQS